MYVIGWLVNIIYSSIEIYKEVTFKIFLTLYGDIDDDILLND